MTDHHKIQEGVGAFGGGRDENHGDRNLTTSPNNRMSGISAQLPSLSPQILQQQQKKMPLSQKWQEPADVKRKNAADKLLSPSEKKEPVNKSPISTICSIFDPSEQGLYDDFCLYNDNNDTDNPMDFHLIAPLTPKSLYNSPSIPTEPRPALLESFDSDEETEYDTVGFFPPLSSIQRRPLPEE